MVWKCPYLKKISQYLLISFFGFSLSLQAQSVDEKIEAELKHLQQIQKELKEKKKIFEQTRAAEQNVLSQLELIEKSLNAQERELQIYERKVKETEKKIQELEKELNELNHRHEEQKNQLNTRMVAIYKLGSLGYLRTLFAARDHEDLIQRIKYLSLIAKNDMTLIAQLDENIKELEAKKKELESSNQKATLYREKVRVKKQEIEDQKAEKTQFLAKLREDKNIYQKLISELEDSSTELENLITAWEKEKEKIKKETESAQGRNAQEFKVPSSFVKGKLIWPVKGKLITRFGRFKYPGTNTYTFYKGIDIEAPEGTPIYAVGKGVIKYADWFKGYGNLIILDHGGNFYTLYAHADEVYVKPGDEVQAQQILGKVGSTDSIKGPYLYFEIRVGGKSVDPLAWLGKS